jgi:RNA-binding protein
MSTSPLLSAGQKRALRSRAQTLDATVRVGQSGVTDALVETLDAALGCHELVKVRFCDFKEGRKSLSPQLAGRTGSALVQIVGNVAVFYRPRSQPDATTSPV